MDTKLPCLFLSWQNKVRKSTQREGPVLFFTAGLVAGLISVLLTTRLTKYEAAEYSNIGINKIEGILRKPNCPFVLYVGPNKKFVKRKEFEEFIRASFMI